jgi:hypothetical protein
MARSLWNFIVIDEDGNSKVYVATDIANVLDSIDYAFSPTAIFRTTLYSSGSNDYDSVACINRRDT